jgi:hypothetical protein
MRCLVTITHRTVEHTDPEAAGFVDGYWWTVSPTSVGLVESATASTEASEACARLVAEAHEYHPDDVDIVKGLDLMSRVADENRVAQMVAAHQAAG